MEQAQQVFGIESITGHDFQNKTVLVRVDYNSAVGADGELDTYRIERSIPTILYLVNHGARVVLLSHFGRPKGFEKKLSLEKAAQTLDGLLSEKNASLPSIDVEFCPETDLDAVRNFVNDRSYPSLIMAQNVRFHHGEKINSAGFAKQLRLIAGDNGAYVNEAFSVSHRKEASVHALPLLFELSQLYGGLNLIQELGMVEQALSRPQEGYAVIIGGAKVEDKLDAIENLLPRVEYVLIGGKTALHVLFAAGNPVEMDAGEIDKSAYRLVELMSEYPGRILLPADFSGVGIYPTNSQAFVLPSQPSQRYLDIGPETVQKYIEIIMRAKTIIHAGPMGWFEQKPFEQGTTAIAKAVAGSDANFKLAGGGDTVAAYALSGVLDKVMASTGGGALLDALAQKELYGITVLRRDL